MSDLCRRCGATITWAVTTGGKRMPLDRDPSKRGNVRIVRLTGTTPVVKVLTRAELDELTATGANTPLYLAHFATCPKARP